MQGIKNLSDLQLCTVTKLNKDKLQFSLEEINFENYPWFTDKNISGLAEIMCELGINFVTAMNMLKDYNQLDELRLSTVIALKKAKLSFSLDEVNFANYPWFRQGDIKSLVNTMRCHQLGFAAAICEIDKSKIPYAGSRDVLFSKTYESVDAVYTGRSFTEIQSKLAEMWRTTDSTTTEGCLKITEFLKGISYTEKAAAYQEYAKNNKTSLSVLDWWKTTCEEIRQKVLAAKYCKPF